uniref:Uncharacterized protein n=1 Tax=Guillardia theta TaxID=55529 RepID=A0A7S4N3W5_GUITH
MSVTMAGGSEAPALDKVEEAGRELVSRRSAVQLLPQSVLGVPANGIAKLMAPKPALCGQDIEVTFDALVFVGHPISLDQRAYSEGSISQESHQILRGSKQLSQRHERLTTFTFVLVVHHGCKSLNHWKEVARSAGLVWVHEQLRSGYLSMEVQRIQDLVQGNISSQERASKENEPKLEGSSTDLVGNNPSHVEIERQKSSLVAEVVEVFESLNVHGSASVLVNSWLNLHVRVGAATAANAPSPRKYDTLLLLQPRDEILRELPADCSLDLALVVRKADPLKTLKRLSDELDIPLQRVFVLSQHLERWSKGRVVQSVSKASIYLIAPEVNLSTVGVSEREGENIAESFDRFMPAEEPSRKGEEERGKEDKGKEERARSTRRKSSRVSRGWRAQGSPKLRLQKALQVFSQGKTLEALQHDVEIQTLAELNVSRWDELESSVIKLIRRKKSDLARVAAWLLEKNLVVELQTYVEFVSEDLPSSSEEEKEEVVLTPAQEIMLAVSMGLHPRIGERSPLMLLAELQFRSNAEASQGSSRRSLEDLLVAIMRMALKEEQRKVDEQDAAARRRMSYGSLAQVDPKEEGDEGWIEEAKSEAERTLRRKLVNSWIRHLSSPSPPGFGSLSKKGKARLWSRLKRMLPFLDGRHTLQYMCEEINLRAENILAIAKRCSEFLVVIRCAV